MKTVFSKLKYPKHIVNSTIKSFVDSKVCDQQQPLSPSQETDDTIRVVLPFKDQISADIVKKQLKYLSLKVHTTIQPVFVSRKIEQELIKCEGNKATNCKSAVCCLQCDLCDAGYVGCSREHLHNRVKGHKQQSYAIAKHYKDIHGTMPRGLLKRFECRNKFDCLVYERLFIRALKLNLNVQSDSIRATVFLLSSHPLMFILRAKIALNAVICMIFFHISLDNGVMTTPKVGSYHSFIQFYVLSFLRFI